MLKSLSIINYALIESLEIEFLDGFSVLTGETGAGKSIILGALSLILGRRADPGVLKDKSKKCVIEGVFDNGNLSLQKFFSDNELDYDGQTIIRREILPSGKSRAFINDTPVNLELLVYLGNKFVNVHSQHETLQLSDASFQLNVLDDFINVPDLLVDYKNVYQSYNSLTKKLQQLVAFNNQAVKDEDYFRYQFEELDKASLNTEEVAELETRAKFLEHSEEIKHALSQTESILNNDENAVIDSLLEMTKIISNIQTYLPNLKELVQRLDSVTIELKDILGEIELLNSDDDFNPHELQLVNEKLSAVYTLIQKHHVQSVDDLITLRNDYDQKLQSIRSLDEEIDTVKKDLSTVKKKLEENAKILHNERTKGSSKFSNAVLQILIQLGMKDAGFVVKIEQLPEFNTTGMDKVQFMFNANLGVEPGEISKIASGGELSRLMLAIKSLINKKQMLPTVIFDEIDAGVSGEIAGKVGSIIKKMSKNHQVISITHLAQIASKADHHYKVHKITTNNSTVTAIDQLNNEGRVEELAKILSNEKVSANALITAREMLEEGF
ncbi:MAG: DNA repair protein RecN [Bacteroidetes bacterium]|nr:DNA repair protein RecN [Bacteroidota bacterium]MBL6943088.1 DNA repair protein RecN [Bacteroidales bacterium]